MRFKEDEMSTDGEIESVFIFSIAARNYLSQVSVLFDSIKNQCGDVKFCCFVVDGFDDISEIPEELKSNVFDCRKLGISNFEEMAFKYGVVEFSTALKPYIFDYIFELKRFDCAVYFDPDIKIYNDIDWIRLALINKSILLTPHLLDFKAYKKNNPGRVPVLVLRAFLSAGTFNLGFVAIRNDSCGRNFVDIWAEILSNECYLDDERSLCVDQKWADYLSSFFSDGLEIIRDPGANVAYWNMHERILTGNAELGYFVNGSELKFMHYSSINMSSREGISAGAQRKGITLINYPEYGELFLQYKDELVKAGFNERMNITPYRFNFFDNGLPINVLHRKIFSNFVAEIDTSNLFSVSGKIYCFLESRNLLGGKKCSGGNLSSNLVRNNQSPKVIAILLYVAKFAFGALYKLLGPTKYFSLLKGLRKIANIETNAQVMIGKKI